MSKTRRSLGGWVGRMMSRYLKCLAHPPKGAEEVSLIQEELIKREMRPPDQIRKKGGKKT